MTAQFLKALNLSKTIFSVSEGNPAVSCSLKLIRNIVVQQIEVVVRLLFHLFEHFQVLLILQEIMACNVWHKVRSINSGDQEFTIIFLSHLHPNHVRIRTWKHNVCLHDLVTPLFNSQDAFLGSSDSCNRLLSRDVFINSLVILIWGGFDLQGCLGNWVSIINFS